MKDVIQAIEITPLFIPLKKQIKTNLHTLTHITCLYLLVRTKQGVTGHCLLDGLGKIPYVEVMYNLENNIIPKLKNMGNLNPLTNWQQLYQASSQLHLIPAWKYGLAALDVALWDIHLKNINISLHRYLGGTREQIPVYGSSGWLSLSNEELVQECQWYASQGVNAFKVRLGHQDDIERIALVRETMGNDFLIMVDANQRYSISEAILIANKLKQFNICWFEEPISSYSIKELKMLSDNISIPVALGENLYDHHSFVEINNSSIIKYIQPDLARIGGITPFMEIAKATENTKNLLCSHLFPELSASILSAFRSAYLLEHDNCFSPDIFTYDFRIQNGVIKVPDCNGTGVELTSDALLEFSNHEKKTIVIK